MSETYLIQFCYCILEKVEKNNVKNNKNGGFRNKV